MNTRWYAIPSRRNGVTPIVPADLERLLAQVGPATPQRETVSEWRPALELVELEDRYVMTLEVPGFTIHDVDVEVEDNTVRVAGRRERVEEEEGTRNVLVSERAWGSFERVLKLPTQVVEGKSRANLKDGLLVIDLPKQEKPRAKKLTIHAAD